MDSEGTCGDDSPSRPVGDASFWFRLSAMSPQSGGVPSAGGRVLAFLLKPAPTRTTAPFVESSHRASRMWFMWTWPSKVARSDDPESFGSGGVESAVMERRRGAWRRMSSDFNS